MKYLMVLLLFIISVPDLPCQTLSWIVQSGGQDFDLAKDVAVDANGNVYTAGSFNGKAQFGAGPLEADSQGQLGKGFLQKVNAQGEVVDVFAMEGFGSGEIHNIALDAVGNIYLSGIYGGEIDFDPDPDTTFLLTSLATYNLFIAKYDAQMQLIWAKSLAENEAYVEADITVDQEGNIYLGGVFNGTIDVDPDAGEYPLAPKGSSDIFLAKYGTDGSFSWAKSMGSERNDACLELVFDQASQTIVSTGYFRETIDTSSIGDSISITSQGSWDVFVQKTNLNGQTIWTLSFGGPELETGYAINVDSDGGIYTVGNFMGRADFDPGRTTFELLGLDMDTTDFLVNDNAFIQKLDIDGNFLWAKRMGSTGFAIAHDLAIDQNKEVYVIGDFHNQLEFQLEDSSPLLLDGNESPFFTMFIGKYSTEGEVLDAFTLGGCNTSFEQQIAVDSEDNLVVSGNFDEVVDFDPSEEEMSLQARGIFDAFTLHLSKAVTMIKHPIQHNTLKVYPNPTSDFLRINELPDNKSDYVVQIYNSAGVLVKQEKYFGDEAIDVAEFPAGMYMLLLMGKQMTYSEKWVKY